MALRRSKRPRSDARLSTPEGSDPSVLERAVQEIGRDLSAIQDGRILGAQVIVADLAIGVNKVAHGLGRAPAFVAVAPAVADASWAWAWLRTTTASPERQVWIECIGSEQRGATIMVY